MNVPQLRFSGFDGEWSTRNFDNVFNIIDGDRGKNYPSSDDYLKEGFCLFLNAKNVSKKGFVFNDTVFINESKDRSMTKGKLKRNDIVMTTRGTIGNIAIYNREVPFENIRINSGMVILRSEVNDSLYNFIFLNSPGFDKTIKFTVFGSAQPQLTVKDIKKMKISFPQEKEEQKKISSFFLHLNQRIGKQKEKIEKLERFKKGMMQKIFSQDLRFKDDDGGEFGEWESCKLSELADVRDGTHDTPKYVPTGYPLVTSKNLNKNGNINWDNISYISEFDYNEINKRSNVEIGDILFGMIGTIGNPVRVKTSNFAIKNVALIKETGKLSNQYLIHYLKSSNLDKQFHLQQAGGTQKFIGLGLIRNLEIDLPTKEEQLKISSYLDALTRKVDLESEKLIALEKQKKGFMQGMFV